MSQHSHLYNDRSWQKLRRRQLDQHPLCERCKAQGRVTAASVCDHVDPHKGDLGKFWAGPFQSLCKPCHDTKTVMEDGGLNSGGQAHPDWLPKPACPVLLITGPPGGGKTTYAYAQARTQDQVIDLDECFLQVCGVHGHKAGRQHLNQALRLRNKRLANLASYLHGKAIVIVSSPSTLETQWWTGKLGATHTLLDPGIEVCLQRVVPERRFLVVQWYAKQKANIWAGPGTRAAGHTPEGIPLAATHHWNVPRGTLMA